MRETAMETVSVEVADGTAMNVFIARPAAAEAPGLLVFQEAFGVNAHIRDVAGRFAREGFVAMAPELFHRSAPPGFEGPYGDFDAVMPHVKALTVEGLEADIRATYELLRNDRSCDGRVSSTGYCMGGRTSFLANSILPLTAAVSYYGGGIAPALLDRAPAQHGPLLLFWGGLDKHIGPDVRSSVRQALEAASRPFIETLFSFADHGFFCDMRPAYNRDAARDAWALTLSFLRGSLEH